MNKHCAILICAGLCLAADDKPKDDALKTELKAMQGAWKVTQARVDGKAIAWMDVEDLGRMIVKGDDIEFQLTKFKISRFARVGDDPRPPWRPVLQTIMRKVEAPAFKVEEKPAPRVTLNPSTKIKQLDIKDEQNRLQGIYSREGDRLTICLAFPGAERPTELKAGAAQIYLTLVRGNEAAQDAARAKSIQEEQEKLNGVWEVGQGVFDTGKLSDKERDGFQLTVRDGKATWKEAGATETLKLQLDPSAQPKAIDLVATEGPIKGKAIKGLYLLEGDQLTLCLPWSYDNPRPRALDVKNEKQVDALIVLKRMAK